MRIGIDIDGVLFPWTRAVNDAVQKQFGDFGLVEEHPSWDYLKDTISGEAWKWCWADGVLPTLERPDLIYPGCQYAVNKLCEEHEVHFVTHRNPENAGAATARWIAEHFTGYRGLHVVTNDVSKVELGFWDLFIDDKPQTVREMLDADVTVRAPRRAWNAEELDSFLLFDHWDEVLELVLDL